MKIQQINENPEMKILEVRIHCSSATLSGDKNLKTNVGTSGKSVHLENEDKHNKITETDSKK